MNVPRATVRLQLHGGFTFRDALDQVPYFAALGISHYYLSPITRARPGSTHGYDVIDHGAVNPELGGEAELTRLVSRLREHGMGLIVDIVPNHMAVDAGNAWWWDVLLHGAKSAYAHWFDIDWNAPDPALRGKVLAPFLQDDLDACLAAGNIRLTYDDAAQAFHIEACGWRYPVAAGSLDGALNPLRCLRDHDAQSGSGREALHALLARQHYRLVWWREAAGSINWRRFFAVNELIGVCVEQPQVFDAVHGLIRRLYAQGWIDGVRVDHVDGLADPLAYCRRLRACLAECADQRPGDLRGQAPWIVVEKILAPGEALGRNWQVDGGTGYDFMDHTGAVLHDSAGQACLTGQWEDIAGDARPVRDYVHEARRLMLGKYFAAQRDGLLRAVCRLLNAGSSMQSWREQEIGHVLDQVLIEFPVYRSYVALDALPGPLWREALRRFQQLTPALAAKSVEDTVFYRYGRLLSRNEVGSNPAVFSLSAFRYHRENARRIHQVPGGMLATATHDHKRGEDVRARLAVLSEVPDAWCRASRRWMDWPGSGPESGPTEAAQRYMLLQTLVGAWPLDLLPDGTPGLQDFMRRLADWQTKALRESQQGTDWLDPDAAYEQRALDFLDRLAPGRENQGLLRDIHAFVQIIAAAGAVNGLAQLVLRNCAPGVPDLYQGTEFWDFSLVDPDNRRPVDFTARQAGLSSSDGDAPLDRLLAEWRDGRIKQAVLARLLRLRRDMPAVFAGGAYAVVAVHGGQASRVLAFLRSGEGGRVMAVVPLRCFHGVDPQVPRIAPSFWDDTVIVPPPEYRGTAWTNVLSGERLRGAAGGALRLADVLSGLPVAVLAAD